ncbi:MAG: T9SS type A sorting domain-containing protein [Flavobacteriaceae bacterium]|jgi:pimeloyl-ACP methyl ester carboxylesterase|nr:T9SS type A sorting domain-containing protein [Flavobacteriaceae bacterium]
MKKITLFVFLGLFQLSQAQENQYDLLEDASETKILYDQVFGLSKITTQPKEVITNNYFNQVYHEVQRADFLNRLPVFEEIKIRKNQGIIQNYIPLAVLISDVEQIKDGVLEQNQIQQTASGQYFLNAEISEPFDKTEIRLMAPLLGKSKTQDITFLLENINIFNTSNKNAVGFYIDTHQGNGFEQIVPEVPFLSHFNTTGNHLLDFKIIFEDGSFVINTSEIYLMPGSSTLQRSGNAVQEIETIQATIPFQGYGETTPIFGTAEYEIFLDNVNGVLDKPIFLVDGFDPGDTRNTTLIYQMLNYSDGNLADLVRDEGFDVVVVNFPQYSHDGVNLIDGGSDFIQRNAMSLVTLIEHINSQKVGDEQNVIIGPSMGGLISRYALRYMEQNNLEHETRLYISFDSPHLGANVPIGFQHMFNYMAYGPLGETTIQGIVDGMLKSPAARQMLIDHFEGHLQSGNATEFNNNIQLPIGAPNFRNAFQTELDNMGFPQTTRNVAISNGSGNGTMTGTPGMWVLNDYIVNSSTTQRARFDLRFTPPADVSNQLVSRFRGQQWVIVWATIFSSQANAASPSTSAGLDSAPGGTFEISNFGGTGEPMIDDFVSNLEIDKFCFIPALSSLAITDTNNWYASVTESSNTPFVNTLVPTENQPHVTLTEANVAFALNEILNYEMNIPQINLLNGLVLQNPMKNNIEIFTSESISNATITLTDASGKMILKLNNQNIQGNLSIPVSLQSGFYIININSENSSISKKLIKN